MRLFVKSILFVLVLCNAAVVAFGQGTPVRMSFTKCEQYQEIREQVVVPKGKPFIIRVNTPQDLSNVNSSIRSAIKKGEKNIEVELASGMFYYERLPFYLYNIDARDVSIHIKGSHTILVAGGRDYSNGYQIDSVSRENIYLDQNCKLIDLFGEVQQAQSEVEIIDENTKLCRLKLKETYLFSPGLKIQLSEWFHSPVYDVVGIKDGYVSFYADNLEYDKSKNCFNVQYDNAIGKMNPRYRFFDPVMFGKRESAFHECSVSSCLVFYQMKLKSFTMSGIDFYGCAKGKNALLYFRDVQADKICISDCRFEFMNSTVCKVTATDNVVFKDNVVRNCFLGAFYSYVDCSNTIVKNNRFYRLGRGWTNCSAVLCYGKGFLVADNEFEDIGYTSIGSGFHSNWGNNPVPRGVIENNEIWFGNEYYKQYDKYTLMDGGAVYIGTQNDQVIVRYNYIHNYRGVKSNRAIYCDDGAMNVKIYGNVITGVTNAHSILSWRAKSINKKFPKSNDGIDFYYNVIWGKYKFDERLGSSCVHGKNLILYAEGETPPENVLNNFAYQEQDLVFSGVTLENGKMKIPSEAMQELKKFPTYEKMKKWFD